MNERQAYTLGLFVFAAALMLMSWWNPDLWDRDLFGILLQGVVLTGILNMAGAFHFTANKQAEKASENTGDAFKAIAAAAASTPGANDAADAADQVADAAHDEAAKIKGTDQ